MILDKYNDCFLSAFDVDQVRLDAGFNFGDEGWDSLAHMELIAALEDTFGIMFETDDIVHYGSYENGKKILANYGIEF